MIFGAGTARYRGRADDDIDVLQVFGEAALLFGAFVVGERTRIAAFACGADAEVEELAAERLDLLACFRTHVEAFDLCAQALGGRDRLQAGDARAHDQHLRGPDRAGRGGEHREEPRRQLRGDQHRLVAGHAGLRTEHIHRLRARGARQLLQRERDDPARGDRFATRAVGLRLQDAEQHRTRLHPRDRIRGRRLHARDDIGVGDRRLRIIDQLRTRVGIGLVREVRVATEAALDPHRGAGGNEFLAGFRRQRDALLARRGFARNTQDDRHASAPMASPRILANARG